MFPGPNDGTHCVFKEAIGPGSNPMANRAKDVN
jgi:hypothetical protein